MQHHVRVQERLRKLGSNVSKVPNTHTHTHTRTYTLNACLSIPFHEVEAEVSRFRRPRLPETGRRWEWCIRDPKAPRRMDHCEFLDGASFQRDTGRNASKDMRTGRRWYPLQNHYIYYLSLHIPRNFRHSWNCAEALLVRFTRRLLKPSFPLAFLLPVYPRHAAALQIVRIAEQLSEFTLQDQERRT